VKKKKKVAKKQKKKAAKKPVKKKKKAVKKTKKKAAPKKQPARAKVKKQIRAAKQWMVPKGGKPRLYASNASQWVRCSGLLNLEKNGYPFSDRSGADLGNGLHRISEKLLKDWGFQDITYFQLESFIDSAKTLLKPVEILALNDLGMHDAIEYISFYFEGIRQDIEYQDEPTGLSDLQVLIEHKMTHEHKKFQVVCPVFADFVFLDLKL